MGPPARCWGTPAFGDTIKQASYQSVARLRELGIRTIMLTGDNQGSAKAVATELGIDEVRAELLPGDKAAVVRELRAQGHVVAMVGDGLNDAPSLAAADVGLSMSTGTDVAMEAAGITLMRGDPRLVADSFDVSRRTYGKIKQGLFWAFRSTSGHSPRRTRHAEPGHCRRGNGVQQRERRSQCLAAAALARRGS